MAEVTPLPMVGDLHQVKNWIPINQTKLPGKLLERIVPGQLATYFDDILHNNQHGFRSKKSTGTAIFDVLQEIGMTSPIVAVFLLTTQRRSTPLTKTF